ncbi:hypothetical protein C8R44DRAFT_886918 [Mycena epipterygia]|nr:hypothetical protein C8R44DRAFT_886918 [Mycena epipterygia]
MLPRQRWLPHWDFNSHPLGPQWMLSPERYRDEGAKNTCLGYSIEPSCRMRAFVPHTAREAQIYVMGKNGRYFAPEGARLGADMFELAATTTQARFFSGIREDGLPTSFRDKIANVGPMGQEDFYARLANSVALVGIGSPGTFLTPYDALCLGVPFINPIDSWNAENPQDRTP